MPRGSFSRAAAILVIGVLVGPPICHSQVLVDDLTPWWLWADSWRGEFSYIEETKAAHYVDQSSYVKGALVLDKREVKGCTVEWVGEQPNRATLVEHGEGRMNEQTEVANIRGSTSSSARGVFPLSPQSGLSFSMENRGYKIYLTAANDATVSGTFHVDAAVDASGVHQETRRNDADDEVVEFADTAYKSIPESVGVLDDSLIEKHGGGDLSYRHELHWVLQPRHDIDRWAVEYTDFLELQRKTFIDRQQSIIDDFDCDGENSGKVYCRAARMALENVDRRVARLTDDCRRILGKLLNNECPGFARGMRATGRAWQYEHAVCTSPAMTCDVIHRSAFDYFDSGPTGDFVVTYRRFPNYMTCLYTFDEFEEIATMGSTDWFSQALGQ